MLIAARRLLVKLRQPASRADELIDVRERLRAERAAAIEPEERALAESILEQKLALAATLGAVSSCSSCATGHAWPNGRYDGGDCCAGHTPDLFDDGELSALAHAGTRPSDLTPPPGADDHAGCAFRGSRGCSLEVAHRPARCVHYVCDILRRELHSRGQLDDVEAQYRELDRRMQQFLAVHVARQDREVVAPIVAALTKAARR